MSESNNVEYGLSEVHFAMATLDDEGVATYGAWQSVPYAQKLTPDKQIASTDVSADDRIIATISVLTAIKLSMQFSTFSDEFKKNFLNFAESTNGSLVEKTTGDKKYVAAGFKVKGDKKNRILVYPLTEIGSFTESEDSTIEGSSVTVKTSTLNLTVLPFGFGDDNLAIKEIINSTQENYSAFWNTAYTMPIPKGE